MAKGARGKKRGGGDSKGPRFKTERGPGLPAKI